MSVDGVEEVAPVKVLSLRDLFAGVYPWATCRMAPPSAQTSKQHIEADIFMQAHKQITTKYVHEQNTEQRV